MLFAITTSTATSIRTESIVILTNYTAITKMSGAVMTESIPFTIFLASRTTAVNAVYFVTEMWIVRFADIA